MRKITILLFFSVISKFALAQADDEYSRFNFMSLSLGAGASFMPKQAFNNWAKQNYGKDYQYPVTGYADIGFAGKNYDFGLQVESPSVDFAQGSIYFGRRITSAKSPVTSYLNVEVGWLDFEKSDIAPLNYTLSPDQVGQKMLLRYSVVYVGISSRNYINPWSFNIGKSYKFYFRPGFYADIGYMPWDNYWEYGYYKITESQEYDDDGNPYTSKSTQFTGKRVNSVPALANKFINAGFFVAITFSTKKPRKFD